MQHARLKQLHALLVSSALLAAPSVASAERILTLLSGYEEVPAVSTVASGELRGMISPDDDVISYALTYSGLQAAVTQAHVHFAQAGVEGGIVFWLCDTAEFPAPVEAPPCPQEGTVSGTITAANILATEEAQQIAEGDLAAVIAAIRAGTTYANVHTALSPGGEVRGQIRAASR